MFLLKLVESLSSAYAAHAATMAVLKWPAPSQEALGNITAMVEPSLQEAESAAVTAASMMQALVDTLQGGEKKLADAISIAEELRQRRLKRGAPEDNPVARITEAIVELARLDARRVLELTKGVKTRGSLLATLRRRLGKTNGENDPVHGWLQAVLRGEK
jgi:hypothetical protein